MSTPPLRQRGEQPGPQRAAVGAQPQRPGAAEPSAHTALRPARSPRAPSAASRPPRISLSPSELVSFVSLCHFENWNDANVQQGDAAFRGGHGGRRAERGGSAGGGSSSPQDQEAAARQPAACPASRRSPRPFSRAQWGERGHRLYHTVGGEASVAEDGVTSCRLPPRFSGVLAVLVPRGCSD